jgi:uncharacterized protein (TIGR03435 family)
MMIMRSIAPSLAFASTLVLAQAPLAPPSDGPRFEVVSIKRITGARTSMSMNWRPDGAFTMVNEPVRTLISQAYPAVGIVDLPAWAENDRYDVSATATLIRLTTDDRRTMMRAMLAERFSLAVHYETREVPAYDLVRGRSDGRFGPNMKPAAVDCEALAAANRAAAEAARATGAPPPAVVEPIAGKPMPACVFRAGATGAEGDMTMPELARLIVRSAAGRPVVDKTGLNGHYRVKLDFDPTVGKLDAANAATSASDAPSIFTALQEQLGLKLESSRTNVEILVIDRIEKPTEN